MTQAPGLPPTDDPAEIAYLRQRRLARRRQFWSISVAGLLVTGLVARKVGTHLMTAWWLEANKYVVVWTLDQHNWPQGGVTAVRYSARYVMLGSTRPFLDLNHLRNLHALEELDLSTLHVIRDADLANLDELTGLKNLNLDRSSQAVWLKVSSSGLTDATLARVGRLRRLRELQLGGQNISDAGLEHLTRLGRLRSLDLVDTTISDAGLEHLKALPSLRTSDVSRTLVTAQGVANFEAARPDVKVIVDVSLLTPLPPNTLKAPAP